MQGAAAAVVPRVQRREQVDHLGATHLTDQDPVRPVAKRRPEQVRDGHGWKRLFLPHRRLRAPGLETDEVGLIDQDFRGLFDQDDSIL